MNFGWNSILVQEVLSIKRGSTTHDRRRQMPMVSYL